MWGSPGPTGLEIAEEILAVFEPPEAPSLPTAGERLWLLEKGGFKHAVKERCLFYKKNCIMVIYVDDILIIGAKKSDLDQATVGVGNLWSAKYA